MNIKVVYGRDPGSGRPRGGAYREAKVEFGHKLSDGNLVFGHPHYQTDRTTQPGGSDSSGRPHWLQGKPHRVSLKSIRYPRTRDGRRDVRYACFTVPHVPHCWPHG